MTVRLRIISIAVGVLVLVPVGAAAQSLTFGVKGGVNLANISTDDRETKSRLGIVGGVFVGNQINDRFSVQVEGLFSQQGAEDTAPPAGVEDVKYRVNYFNVPVLARFGNTSTGTTHFHFFTGPQAGFKLKAEATGTVGSVDITEDLDDEIKSFDFGWVAGVSLEAGRLVLDARYTLGLTNFATTAGDNGKTRVFSVTAGIRLK